MYHGRSILATICARGGSKGVKNKNIRLLNKKPIICYTLDIINHSKFIDDYIISTDSDDIAKVVKDRGFDIYFKRPECLSGDKISRVDVIRHATLWAEEHFKKKYDIIMDLGVSTPLKISEDVENSIKLFALTKASNVISVTPSRRNPYYNMIEKVNGKISLVKKLTQRVTDRRDAPKVYDMNDGIYVWQRDALFLDMPLFNSDTQIYIMPNDRSVDIDDELDFYLAELLAIKKTKNAP